eukprot:1148009-Amphidinium_carterae.1
MVPRVFLPHVHLPLGRQWRGICHTIDCSGMRSASRVALVPCNIQFHQCAALPQVVPSVE